MNILELRAFLRALTVPPERTEDVAATAMPVYERGRPSYPADAVAWLVGGLGIGPGRDVVDLGAGTGKFTRLLVPMGARLTAPEPSEAMREQFARAVPGVPILDGNATSLPLPDASVDVVTVRYLIWKIREAEKGRINIGPRKTRARDGEPLDVKILRCASRPSSPTRGTRPGAARASRTAWGSSGARSARASRRSARVTSPPASASLPRAAHFGGNAMTAPVSTPTRDKWLGDAFATIDEAEKQSTF